MHFTRTAIVAAFVALSFAGVAGAQDDGLPAPTVASAPAIDPALVRELTGSTLLGFGDDALAAAGQVARAHPQTRTPRQILGSAAQRAKLRGAVSVSGEDVFAADAALEHLAGMSAAARQLLGTSPDAQLMSLLQQERALDRSRTAAATTEPKTGETATPARPTPSTNPAATVSDPRLAQLERLTDSYEHPSATNDQPAQSWDGWVDPNEREDRWETRPGQKTALLRQAIAEWDAGGLRGDGWDAVGGGSSPRERVIVHRLLGRWGTAADRFANRTRFADFERILSSVTPSATDSSLAAAPKDEPPLARADDPRVVKLLALTAGLDAPRSRGMWLPKSSERVWLPGQKEQILRQAVAEWDAGGLRGEGWSLAYPLRSARERVIVERLSPYWRGTNAAEAFERILSEPVVPAVTSAVAERGEGLPDATLAAIRARGAAAETSPETGMAQILTRRASSESDRSKTGER